MTTTRILRTVGLASAAMLLAVSAQAQGRKHERGDDRSHDRSYDRSHDRSHVTPIGRPDVHRRDVYDRDVFRDRYVGRRVPPGLAKKPGQMPPGQFKKRYRAYHANDGVGVLSDVLRRRGDRVVRVVPSGDSRYVYYSVPNGGERWVMVRPANDQLYFDNAPTSLLQAVLERLY